MGVPRWQNRKGEIKEEAHRRELREELSLEININEFFDTVEYDYETFHLTMHCFICSVSLGKITLN